MNCLVTGASGFIGNSLTKRLIKEGYKVFALIHTKKPKIYEKKIEYITCDITKPLTLNNLPKEIDVVFHCASLVKDYGPKALFYKVNVEGTKNLVNVFKKNDIKCFIYLSHIGYESEKNFGYYSISKKLAEKYLVEKYRKKYFPIIILRPGNVYGPGANTWVLRPIEAIKKDRIALINNGEGIFLHTYIDNLIDALITAINTPKAIGKTIDITDGDYSISWGKYLNDLAKITGKKPIKRNFSKGTAMIIANIMVFSSRIIDFKPWITPSAVNILTNDKTVSIKKAEKILNYQPKIGYKQGMKKIENWLRCEGYIT